MSSRTVLDKLGRFTVVNVTSSAPKAFAARAHAEFQAVPDKSAKNLRAVRGFPAEYDDVLAARVKRETLGVTPENRITAEGRA